MSLALLHILVMGFVLVLVLVVVLESFPAEWWSNGVSECCTFSEWDPQMLRTVPTPRRPSAVVPRALRRVLPLRNRIVIVPEPRPTKSKTSKSSSLPN
jgi:hypothetical protein